MVSGPLLELPWGAAITAVQLVFTCTSWINEVKPGGATAYSKFSSGGGIPSRLGMLIIYTPALIAAATLTAEHGFSVPTAVGQPGTIATLLMLHFGKRVAEVLVVHKYSGTVSAAIASSIGVYYALVTVLIKATAISDPIGFSPDNARAFGLVLFGVGQLGNLYHHSLLASLRAPGSHAYVVPSGGLFGVVAAPHYFFELIAWWGLAMVADHLNVYLVAAAMTSYLGGRSVAQNRYNREKFKEEWPRSRRNLVPFLF